MLIWETLFKNKLKAQAKYKLQLELAKEALKLKQTKQEQII